MTDSHIVSSFDRDLADLNRLVARLGGLAEQQFAAAIDALENRDVSSIDDIIAGDSALDRLEQELNDRAIEVIATRAPMARDLRSILSAVKIASVLERVGDYAKNIAKRSRVIIQEETNRSDTISLARIADIVQGMLRQVLDAYATGNAEQAMDVWARDQEVDALYSSLHGDVLAVIAKGAEQASVSSHFLFIAKNIERIGDHTTAVAEQVYFQVHGSMPTDERPKADLASGPSVTT
ncbi:MAG: phosphate signaling complex protein PhoU [Alphaproteobacteria bacterium]|jgi:phosphate transport system protein|nr:phosphate signaling complex protein PhoU [Alphaproteobacteria bacterium]